MSHKSKNLQYEMEEPAFLRRLRQQHAGGGGPDRYIAPRNKKTAVDDTEDAPAYVMEGSEVSRAEFDALAAGKKEIKEDEEEGEASTGALATQTPGEEKGKTGEEKEGEEGKARKDNVAEIGGKGRKRKATKIGGDDEEGEKEKGNGKEEEGKEKKGKTGKVGGKPKKRAVKLSFDQE